MINTNLWLDYVSVKTYIGGDGYKAQFERYSRPAESRTEPLRFCLVELFHTKLNYSMDLYSVIKILN